MKKYKLQNFHPMTIDVRISLIRYYTVIALVTFVSFIMFVLDYLKEYNKIYYYRNSIKVHDITPIKSFKDILLDSDCMVGFLIIIVLLIACIFVFYLSHKQGSKSIYLMRRLPKKYEFLIRCITLPLLGVLCTVVIRFIFWCLCASIYYGMTPSVNIPL